MIQKKTKQNPFKKTFILEHIRQNGYIYLLLLLCEIYIIYQDSLITSVKWIKVLDGISFSFVSAYIFYIVVNVLEKFSKQKMSINVSRTLLDTLILNTYEIISLMTLFMKDDSNFFDIPNNIIYVKHTTGKDFFNPRIELTQNLNKNLQTIQKIYRGRNISLPEELEKAIIDIETFSEELLQKLGWLYDCLDKHCQSQFGGNTFEFCVKKLRDSSQKFKDYIHISRQIKGYHFQTDDEIKEYKKFIEDTLSQLPNISSQKIYKGSIRIK